MMTRHAYALVLAGIIFAGAVYAVPNQRAFAHTFTGDESASFLALVESIKVELDLVQSNIETNVTLAEEHAEHAHEHLDEHTIEEISERNDRLGTTLPAALEDLHMSVANSTAQEVQTKIQRINDLLAETVAVRVESNQLSNSTVWALVLANMADGVISHYGAAYGIKTEEGEAHGHDDEESGNMTQDDMNAMEHDDMEGSMSGDNMTMEENMTIVDMASYQSAQGMAARTQALFNEQVKELAPSNSTQAIADLEAGLEHLIQAIDNREPFIDVETILHSEVHPNLQSAFNLQVIPEFPLPMLLVIPAIAGIIAATRISALRRK